MENNEKVNLLDIYHKIRIYPFNLQYDVPYFIIYNSIEEIFENSIQKDFMRELCKDNEIMDLIKKKYKKYKKAMNTLKQSKVIKKWIHKKIYSYPDGFRYSYINYL
tara:strand:- start:14 stop:331 length:318 start_codon:yes stop_codon:yes gene_type:complete